MLDTVLLALLGCFVVTVGYAVPTVLHNRHRHGPWRIVGTRYSPPDAWRNFEGSGRGSVDIVRRLITGFTTITERCDDPDCQLVRTRIQEGEVHIDGES